MSTSSNKSKINKKFIILVGGFLLFAAVVLGGIFYWSYSAAPERNIKMGDELVVTAKAAEAAGNADEAYKKYQEAISRFGRAISKKPNNLVYTQKIIDALDLMTPKTSGDAQELYQTREAYLQRRTRSAPENGEVWLQLINSLNERALLFNQSDVWKRVAEVCEDATDRIPPTSPQFALIQSTGICAELNRGEILTASERETAETTAETFLKKFPQDENVWASLLRSIAFDVQSLTMASRMAEAKERDAKFNELLVQAKSDVPISAKIGISELQYLLLQKRNQNPLATPKSILAVLDPLLWKDGNRESLEFGTCATLAGNKLVDLSTIASSLNDPIVLQRSIESLQSYCDRHPNSQIEINTIGKLQVAAEQFDKAQVTFEQLLAMPAPKVSMLAAFVDEVKSNALEDLFGIEFSRFESATLPAEKIAALAKVQAVRDRLSKILPGRDTELSLLRLDAKLAFARGDYLTTVTKLEEIFAKQKDVAADLYYLSVISLNARGEQGAALTKISQALEQYPQVGQFYLIRAGIEARLGRLMDAKRTISNLLVREPENAEGLRFMAELKKVPGDGSVNLTDQVIKIIGDAELSANEGFAESAVEQIRVGLVTYPKDARLQQTLCQWLLFLGKTKEAQDAIAQYLVDSPNDPTLKQLQILATVPSALARINAFLNQAKPDGTFASETEKAVSLALALTNLRDSLKQRLQTASEEAKPVIAAELAEVTAAGKLARAKAMELAPGDISLLDKLYAESIADKNPELAEQLVVMAEKNCKDPTIAVLLRGRIALEKNDPAKAAELFEQAVLMPGASAAAFRLLGIAREKNGDVEGATEAFATSYERRPNDLTTVQLYTANLVRAGKIQKVREVMRSAMLAMPESPVLRNAFFDLEATYGNLSDSILERKRMYAIRPSDIENARQLMKLLIESPPSRDLIFNNDGSYRFSDVAWDAMGKERQDQELQSIALQHEAESKLLYDSLLKINPNDHLTTRIYAAAMQRAGKGAEAEANLFSAAQKATGVDAWKYWVELGELQLEANRVVQADLNFKRALELDTSASSDASQIIGKIWIDRREPKRARQIFEDAFAKKPNVQLARNISALRLETRDFVGSRAMSMEVVKMSGGVSTFGDKLLLADISNAEMEESYAKSDPVETKRIFGEFLKAIDEAIRLEPSSPLPFIVRGSSFQRQFQRSGDVELARKAKLDVQRAIELQGSYWPSYRLLASIQLDGNDVSGAVQTVRKFIDQNPRVEEARRALIAYQLTSGDYVGAIQTVQDILLLEPRNPLWLRTLADTHVAASLRLEAAKDNELLFSITKDPNFLVQSILLRSLNSPPDFVGILAALKLAPELVPTTPFFQMIGAAAIAGTAVSEAQKNQGILQLREMYKLVEPTKGSLTDPWILAARCLFPPETSQKLEPFVLEACGNKPDSPLCRALAQTFLDAGSSGTAKALEYSKRALELATTDDEKFNAIRILGGAEYKSGNFVEAGKWFEQSLAIRQDDMAAINNLAYIEAKFLNKVPQAIERARNAFVTNPANADLMDTLGYCLMKSGQVPEALSLMRRSTRTQPTAMAYAHLAEALILSGRNEEALGSLERAKALRPDAEAQEQIDVVTKSLDAAPRG